MFDEKRPVVRKGRPKGSLNKRTIFAREWAERVGCDPVEFMCTVMSSETVYTIQTDADGNAVLDAEGNPIKKLTPVPLSLRVDCARHLSGLMYPRLQATSVTGQVDVPIHRDQLPIDAILADPALTNALSTLALMIAEAPDDDTGPPRAALPRHISDIVIGN